MKNSPGVILDEGDLVGKFVFSRLKHIEAYTLLIFPLLTLAMGSVAYGLSYLVRDLTLSPLLIISIGALLLSWLLARTKSPGWVAYR